LKSFHKDKKVYKDLNKDSKILEYSKKENGKNKKITDSAKEKKDFIIGINKISSNNFSTKFEKNKYNKIKEDIKNDINFEDFLSDKQKIEEEIQRENRRQRLHNIKLEKNNSIYNNDNKYYNNNDIDPIIEESYKNLNINNVILKKNENIDDKSILLKNENNNYLDDTSKNQDLVSSKINEDEYKNEYEIKLKEKISEEFNFIKENIDFKFDSYSKNFSIEERQKLLKMVDEEREKTLNKGKNKYKII
jgi:hypothetical protein